MNKNIKTIKTIAKETVALIKEIENKGDISVSQITLHRTEIVNSALYNYQNATVLTVAGASKLILDKHELGRIEISNTDETTELQITSNPFINENGLKGQVDKYVSLEIDNFSEIVPEIRDLLETAIQSILMVNPDKHIQTISVFNDENFTVPVKTHAEIADDISDHLFQALRLLEINHDINGDELDQDVLQELDERVNRFAEPRLDPIQVDFRNEWLHKAYLW